MMVNYIMKVLYKGLLFVVGIDCNNVDWYDCEKILKNVDSKKNKFK